MTDEIFTSTNGDRPNATNLAIVITDGNSTIDEHRTIPEAKRAMSSDTIVIGVGITDKVRDNKILILYALKSLLYKYNNGGQLRSHFRENSK